MAQHVAMIDIVITIGNLNKTSFPFEKILLIFFIATSIINHQSSLSRLTKSIEKAGKQIAMYSHVSSKGLL